MKAKYPQPISLIFIKFPAGNKFHNTSAMQQDKKLKIEDIINRICGTNIQIEGELEGEARKNSESDFVNKVLNFFDGEILEKR